MAASNSTMIHKLQRAINAQGEKLLYDTQQFYSNDQNRPITMYRIRKTYKNEATGRNKYVELFSSASQIQIVLFLRDYWYEINGWEVPTDNEMWEKIKARYKERRS